LEVLKDDDYLRVARSLDMDGYAYSGCYLLPKGKVAATQPDKLLNSSSIVSNITISGSVNAPIGLFQNASNNTFNANQTSDTKITETIKIIDSSHKALEPLPEVEREFSTIHLDNLKEEVKAQIAETPKR
jgi:hypothetical protein